VNELTEFQKRVLQTIESGPNQHANTWEIVWNGFSKEWNAKRSGHGALFRCILQAGQTLQTKGFIVVLPPRDQHDTYTFCSLSKQKAAEHRVQPTPLSLSSAETLGDNSRRG
jgi:hypothetical protein